MSQESVTKLQIATKEKIQKFNSLRAREVRPGEFWDVVAVTAADESQRAAYELQVRQKVDRKELPLGPHYKVFSDPPGPKIGNGGSTLYALQQLNDIYGKALERLRVILIHAGGFSQRLPSASALGKIFTAVPLGDPLYQMLELKLALYVDFPSRMKPGVLVSCADDVELYSTGGDEGVRFDQPGFTALAHPSSLSVGTTHGVFVLDPDKKSGDSEVENVSCLRFLHKPSVAEMRDSGAVRNSSAGCFSLADAEFVYTDSTYYVDSDTAKSLLAVLKELGPLRCEVDAYGDFLQALGPRATVDYTANVANVAKEEGSLVAIRQKIFHLLKGTPLSVILLNNSKFYHIGTTSEYLFHLARDAALRAELGLLPSAFSVNANEESGRCVMHSVLDPACSVGAGSVVEYCRVGAGARVGGGCVLSGCWVAAGLSVPDGVFMHSLCVTRERRAGFVTVAFGVEDDLKRGADAPSRRLAGLRLFGVGLPECLSRWGLSEGELRFSGDAPGCSLWNACLFPVCSDRQSSFSLSLEMLQAALSGLSFAVPKDTALVSMRESLTCKNLEEMLQFRGGLYEDITRGKRDNQSS